MMKRMICVVLAVSLILTAAFTVSAVPAITYGNLNGDEQINAADALLVLQSAVQRIELKQTELFYADVNGDDSVNANDALQILKHAVWKLDRFTVSKEVDYTVNYEFNGSVSKDVLCSYLDRAVTVSRESGTYNTDHVRSFILNTGAKYICRAATCWSPSLADYATYPDQKAFIDSVHAADPDVVFEACIFECISLAVNEIPIPSYVFEAFGLTPEERNFSFDAMRFSDGKYLNQWGQNTAVPDITNQETMMFFYYRACEYIKLGYEGLHMGQVHLIGADDMGFDYWSQLLAMIREFASVHARRKFVFINAHTHGIYGSDGNLLFDFHMYPSRPMAEGTEAHRPGENDPQHAYFDPDHSDSIYGKSLGGMTYSGWECDSLPYLVELDNYGCNEAALNIPNPGDMRCWGMDEISWYANQPASYRAAFLQYAYDYVTNKAEGDGFFAMPGQRVAFLYDENNTVVSWQYYAYDSRNFAGGFDDEQVIKEIWSQ